MSRSPEDGTPVRAWPADSGELAYPGYELRSTPPHEITMQILTGSLILGVCSLIHLGLLVGSVRLLKAIAPDVDHDPYL